MRHKRQVLLDLMKKLNVAPYQRFYLTGTEFVENYNPYFLTEKGLFDCDSDYCALYLYLLLEGKVHRMFEKTSIMLSRDELTSLGNLVEMLYAKVEGITRLSTPSKAWDELVIEHEGGKLRIPIKDNQFEVLENKRFYKLHELGLEQ